MKLQRMHFVAALLSALALAACAAPPRADTPRVFFSAPADGSTVSSPLRVTMGAENFTIEPAGEVKAGAGHLHIMVDTDCVADGRSSPGTTRTSISARGSSRPTWS